MRFRRLLQILAAALAAVTLWLGSALPAWAAEAMTLTFVRHGESEANAAGVIDTTVPGPHLTELAVSRPWPSTTPWTETTTTAFTRRR